MYIRTHRSDRFEAALIWVTKPPASPPCVRAVTAAAKLATCVNAGFLCVVAYVRAGRCSMGRVGSHRQVLDVRSVDASEAGLTAGSAANLIAVDAQRLMDTAGSLHELWGLPLQVRT